MRELLLAPSDAHGASGAATNSGPSIATRSLVAGAGAVRAPEAPSKTRLIPSAAFRDEARELRARVDVPGGVELHWVPALAGYRIAMWGADLACGGVALLVLVPEAERAAWEQAFARMVRQVFGGQ